MRYLRRARRGWRGVPRLQLWADEIVEIRTVPYKAAHYKNDNPFFLPAVTLAIFAEVFIR